MDLKEEIRAKLNIEDIIGEYVELRRSGRNLKALSPFSQEKTPSFMVSPEKQIWHDFSSNRGGDIFSFVMEVEGLDFKGALELLARKAGLDASLYQNDKAKEFHKKRLRMIEALELATKFYEFALGKSKRPSDYWAIKRGFSPEIISRFRLGYAPADNALSKFLLGRGFSVPELKSAGLLTQRSRGPGDMFRERVMVPLSDGQGRVVGFTARMLGDDKNAPKYINTPQTMLYDKGRQVFGLHLAKEAIREKDYAVIVEGNLDVIASHQAGERAVVATAGTAVTREHLGQLSRLTPHIKLAFDGDKAGLAASERAIAIAQELGIELSIIVMPEGIKDPDELIQKDPNLWQQAIGASVYAMDWVISRYEARCDLTSAEGKREFTTKTLEVVRKLQDPVEREHYLRKIAAKTEVSHEALQQKMQAIGQKVPPKQRKSLANVTALSPDLVAYQDNFLAILARYPATRDVFTRLAPGELYGEQRQALAAYLQQHREGILENVPGSLQNWDTYVKIVLFIASERQLMPAEADCMQDALALSKRIKKEHIREKIARLSRELEVVERRPHDAVDTTELTKALAKLIKEYGHA